VQLVPSLATRRMMSIQQKSRRISGQKILENENTKMKFNVKMLSLVLIDFAFSRLSATMTWNRNPTNGWLNICVNTRNPCLPIHSDIMANVLQGHVQLSLL